jgi:hypothetical protein
MRKPYLRSDVTSTVTQYSYPITTFAGIDADTKEDSLPLNYATYGYNICLKNGVLTNGIGIEYPDFEGDTFPDVMLHAMTVIKIFFYKHFDYTNGVKDDRVIAFLGDGQIYQASLDSEEFVEIENMEFTSSNVVFLNYYYNGADCLIGMSDSGEMIIYDGDTATTITSCPSLIDACVHYDRIYGIVANSSRVYFSAILDPTDWSSSLDSGGYITLTDEGGQVKKIVSFKDSLYIFREYSIHKLTAYADQTDFNMSKVYTSNNQIYTNTVAVCNDRIIFLADDGFYSFDGYTCTKIMRGVFPLLDDKTYSVGCYFNHKYYVASNLIKDDEVVGDEIYTSYEMKNNAMFVYDLDLGEECIFRGADIKGFMPVSLDNVNKLLVNFNNTPKKYSIGQISETGKLFSTALMKKWQSPVTNFEKLNKDKVLKKLYITTTAQIELTTSLDDDYVFDLYSSSRPQMVLVNKRADKVGLTITTEEDTFTVSGLLLEFEFIRRQVYE